MTEYTSWKTGDGRKERFFATERAYLDTGGGKNIGKETLRTAAKVIFDYQEVSGRNEKMESASYSLQLSEGHHQMTHSSGELGPLHPNPHRK